MRERIGVFYELILRGWGGFSEDILKGSARLACATVSAGTRERRPAWPNQVRAKAVQGNPGPDQNPANIKARRATGGT